MKEPFGCEGTITKQTDQREAGLRGALSSDMEMESLKNLPSKAPAQAGLLRDKQSISSYVLHQFCNVLIST